MPLFGMISTQGYEYLLDRKRERHRQRASHSCFRNISLPSDGEEEWLINRAESSEWTVIRECLIASVAQRSGTNEQNGNEEATAP